VFYFDIFRGFLVHCLAVIDSFQCLKSEEKLILNSSVFLQPVLTISEPSSILILQRTAKKSNDANSNPARDDEFLLFSAVKAYFMYASEFTYLSERSLRDRSSFIASKRNIFLGKNFGNPIIKKFF
jgi:hypothetical protein